LSKKKAIPYWGIAFFDFCFSISISVSVSLKIN